MSRGGALATPPSRGTHTRQRRRSNVRTNGLVLFAADRTIGAAMPTSDTWSGQRLTIVNGSVAKHGSDELTLSFHENGQITGSGVVGSSSTLGAAALRHLRSGDVQ